MKTNTKSGPPAAGIIQAAIAPHERVKSALKLAGYRIESRRFAREIVQEGRASCQK